MQGLRQLIAYLGCALPALYAAPAQAHPHVWTDYWLEAVSDKAGITQLRFTWRFDTMFSAMVREDMKIKQLTPEAIKKLRDKAFGNLKNYHYYTYITYDGTAFLPSEVQDFTAREHGEQLEYSFTVALPKAAQKVEVTLYDEELYVDIGPPMQDDGPTGSLMAKVQPKAQNYVSASAVNGATPADCTQREGETKANPVWGNYKTFVATCTVRGQP